MPATSSSIKFKAYLAFALVSFFWGTTYMGIRIGVQYMPPLFMAAVRQTIAGALIAAFFLIKKHRLPTWDEYKWMLIASLLMIAGGNGLVTWGEQYVNSGLTALLCSLTPIWVLVLDRMFGGKGIVNKRIVAGLVLGIVGMLLIFCNDLKDFANPSYTLGIVAIALANIAWAGGTIIVSRRKGNFDPSFSAGIQMFSAGIVLGLLSIFFEGFEVPHIEANGLWALAYLIVFGSMIAYAAYLYALKHLPAMVVSVYAYINTIVALGLGFLLLNEKLTLPIILGSMVTIVAVYLVNSAKKVL